MLFIAKCHIESSLWFLFFFVQESNSSESQDEKEETTALASSELDTETITNTVTSTMTMQEYFAQRMARLNKPQGQAQRPQTSEMSARSGESSPSHLVDNSSTRQLKIKKKKKDKRAADVAEEKCDAPLVIECEDPEQVYSEKKKRKKEKRKMHNDEQFLAPEETPPSKKKKAKKHKKETEPVNGLVSSADQNVESEVVVKQEKKHVVQEDTGVEKKSKKKRKNRVETKWLFIREFKTSFLTPNIFPIGMCLVMKSAINEWITEILVSFSVKLNLD